MPEEILALAHELLRVCRERAVEARLLGGVAVALRCPSASRPELARRYNDLDFVVYRNHAQAFEQACSAVGFQANKRFNALHGDRRLLFRREDVDLDCFVQVFEQCHKLDFAGRFPPGEDTIALADLLLTKLQVVQVNEKDLTDATTILLDYAPAAGGELDLDAMLQVVKADWGWFTTTTDNLERLPEVARARLPEREAEVVARRCQDLREAMESVPKTLAWRLRARVGRRIPWYELPEEKER